MSSTWKTIWRKWHSSKGLQICRSESDEDRMARECSDRGSSLCKSESLIDSVRNHLKFVVTKAEKAGKAVRAKAREVV